MSTYDIYFSNFGRPPVPDDLWKDSLRRHPRFWRRRFFKGFYHIWAWRPSWSMDRDHFSNFSFPQPKEAPYEIWAKLAQGLLEEKSFENVNGRTHGRTHGRTDDGRKVIIIAHPEHSSGELKMLFNYIISLLILLTPTKYILRKMNWNVSVENTQLQLLSVFNL